MLYTGNQNCHEDPCVNKSTPKKELSHGEGSIKSHTVFGPHDNQTKVTHLSAHQVLLGSHTLSCSMIIAVQRHPPPLCSLLPFPPLPFGPPPPRTELLRVLRPVGTRLDAPHVGGRQDGVLEGVEGVHGGHVRAVAPGVVGVVGIPARPKHRRQTTKPDTRRMRGT